ncbi:MAG TPA: lyase [Sphingomonadaceae bacterium]|nr:lyase [Sphingomonadaceae bacterium]
MRERYLPPSNFLQAVINEEISFGESEFEKGNLHRLIAMTRDADAANRDWATLLLSQLELDLPEVRDALVLAASDEVLAVRSEAMLGLAMLDAAKALPFLQRELTGKCVNLSLLEAAAIVGHSSLLPDLMAFAEPSDDPWLDEAVHNAIAACKDSG